MLWGDLCKIKWRDFTYASQYQNNKQHPPQTIAIITATAGWSIIGLAVLEKEIYVYEVTTQLNRCIKEYMCNNPQHTLY